VEAASTNTMTATVFAGGEMDDTVEIAPASVVIAADSGYDIARARGIDVDVLVGDMDSISDDGLAEATALAIPIERYPVDKDATDLEIAIDAAIRLGADDVTVYAGEGGRFDHLLGVALGLTSRRWENIRLVWKVRGSTVHRVVPSRPLTVGTRIGATVTLLPVGDVAAATATGLQWPLESTDLDRGTTHGLSNVAIAPTVSVTIETGALLVIIEEMDPE